METPLDLGVSASACPQPGRPLGRKAGERGQAPGVASGTPARSGTELGEKRSGVWEKARWPRRGRALLHSCLLLLCSAPTEPDRDRVLPLPYALGLHSDNASDRLPLCLPRGPLDQVSWGLLSSAFSSPQPISAPHPHRGGAQVLPPARRNGIRYLKISQKKGLGCLWASGCRMLR